MEMEAEQKTKVVVNSKANILAIASAVISFVAWPLIASCIKETHALYICWVIWFGAFLCGVMSLKAIKNIKGVRWSRVVAWIGCVLSIFLALGITCIVSDRYVMDRNICSVNLRVLGKSIRTYCQKHNGEFPDPSKWCDLIISEPNNEFKNKNYNPNFLDTFCAERFSCLTALGVKSGYAFNKNLAGKRISEVDSNVVVLFETNASDLNQYGSQDLIYSDKHEPIFGESGFHVLYIDKEKPVVKFVLRSEVKNLRWEP